MIDSYELQEELFCVGYEARIFAGYVNYGRIERWVPSFTDDVTEDSHMKRYSMACKYTENKVVLDIACGSGKGAFTIANEGKAESVLAVDIDREALRYANHRFKNDKIRFEHGDASTFEKKNVFDIIVSFETVEHLKETEGYFNGINQSLKNEGLFLISTPISAREIDDKPENIYHVREWGFQAFQREVKKYLNINEIYLQLYPVINRSLISRFKKKVKRMLGIKYAPESNLSTIYKLSDLPPGFSGKKLGKIQRGYQILVCSKNTTALYDQGRG